MEPLDRAYAPASVLEDIRTRLDKEVFTLRLLLQIPAPSLTSAAAWLGAQCGPSTQGSASAAAVHACIAGWASTASP